MGWTAGHFPLYSLLLHNLTSKYSVCVLWGGFFLFTFSFQCLPPLLLNSFGRCQIFIILTTISICFLKIAKCRKQTSNSTANSIQSQVSVLEQVFTKLLIIKRVIKSCNHIYIYIMSQLTHLSLLFSCRTHYFALLKIFLHHRDTMLTYERF